MLDITGAPVAATPHPVLVHENFYYCDINSPVAINLEQGEEVFIIEVSNIDPIFETYDIRYFSYKHSIWGNKTYNITPGCYYWAGKCQEENNDTTVYNMTSHVRFFDHNYEENNESIGIVSPLLCMTSLNNFTRLEEYTRYSTYIEINKKILQMDIILHS